MMSTPTVSRVTININHQVNTEHNELALTKLTSRVSLRGLILMAKAWALRWRCFLLNPSSEWQEKSAGVRTETLRCVCARSENTGQPKIIITSWYNLQADHLGTCTKDLQAFWLLVFPLETHSNNNNGRMWNRMILLTGQMLRSLWGACLLPQLGIWEGAGDGCLEQRSARKRNISFGEWLLWLNNTVYEGLELKTEQKFAFSP